MQGAHAITLRAAGNGLRSAIDPSTKRGTERAEVSIKGVGGRRVRICSRAGNSWRRDAVLTSSCGTKPGAMGTAACTPTRSSTTQRPILRQAAPARRIVLSIRWTGPSVAELRWTRTATCWRLRRRTGCTGVVVHAKKQRIMDKGFIRTPSNTSTATPECSTGLRRAGGRARRTISACGSCSDD